MLKVEITITLEYIPLQCLKGIVMNKLATFYLILNNKLMWHMSSCTRNYYNEKGTWIDGGNLKGFNMIESIKILTNQNFYYPH